MAGDDLLSISEVGEAAGLESSALRYYEKAGLITPAARVGGRRHYTRSVLDRLAAVALLQTAGFTIAEIARLLSLRVSRDQWRAMAEQKLRQIEDHLERVTAAKELLISALGCDCSGLDRCELVSKRRGRHGKVTQRLFGEPAMATARVKPARIQRT